MKTSLPSCLLQKRGCTCKINEALQADTVANRTWCTCPRSCWQKARSPNPVLYINWDPNFFSPHCDDYHGLITFRQPRICNSPKTNCQLGEIYHQPRMFFLCKWTWLSAVTPNSSGDFQSLARSVYLNMTKIKWIAAHQIHYRRTILHV